MSRFRHTASILATLAISGPASAQCWEPTFGAAQGAIGVRVFAEYDDGSGVALYAGGSFQAVGGNVAPFIARWDGTEWSGVGGGTNAHLHALAVFDDGSGAGPALYAGGNFTVAGGIAASYVARWDGTAWSPLGSGPNGEVISLAVHDDGSGPALYVGGSFTAAGGVAANRVAKWDGVSWSALGSGTNNLVWALISHDDGSGPALYAAGSFTAAGGMPANHIARWNGTTWSTLGGNGVNDQVNTMSVHDDGTGGGPELFVGGSFTHAGGSPAAHVAKWNGSGWSALGAGTEDHVNAFVEYDDGNGVALYMGGDDPTGGPGWEYIMKWNGTSWSLIEQLEGGTYALLVHDDGRGAGPLLFAGGDFLEAGAAGVIGCATWDGRSWSALGNEGLNGGAGALAVYDDGSGNGPELYAGGSFKGANGALVQNLVKWDGASWLEVGGGTSTSVHGLCVYDDGSGEKLYVATTWIDAWNGSNWTSIPDVFPFGGMINAMTVHDDGSGPALYVGGGFGNLTNMNLLARWNGTTWSPVGDGVGPFGFLVHALVEHDDGSGGGPELYVGGSFTTAGTIAVTQIAKWDGTSWSALGSGVDSYVLALAVYDDGSGPALYAGGGFTMAGGSPANYIAKWDGTSWSALGSGVDSLVDVLAVYDGELYAGGDFENAGGVPALGFAKWNGTTWSAVEGELNDDVSTMIVHDDGGVTGSALIVSGGFDASPSGDSFIAKWGKCSLASYCTAGVSASGCQALLSAGGTASATAPSGFTLQADTVEGSKDGLFFFGTNGQQANPWGNGTSYQCVVPPVVRAGTLSGSGTIGACDGSFAQDLNALWCPSCPKPAKNPGAGAVVQAQLWYRDPASTSNQTTSLSDAIEFVVGL